MQRAPCAPNGPDHLGFLLRPFQTIRWSLPTVAGAAIVIGLVWVQLLRCCTSAMVYGSLAFIPILLCTLGTLVATDIVRLNIDGEEGREAKNITMAVLYGGAALYLCVFLCLRRSIPLTIQLLKAAGEAISAKLYIFPVCATLFVLYAAGTLLLATGGTVALFNGRWVEGVEEGPEYCLWCGHPTAWTVARHDGP